MAKLYIGGAMKPCLLFFLPLIWLACKNPPAAPVVVPETDTAVLYDSAVYNSNYDSMRLVDSVDRIRVLDSFHAIKPLAVYRWEGDHDPFYKMIKPIIDTMLLVRTPVPFSDTIIYQYNEGQTPRYNRLVYKGKGLVVVVSNPDAENYSKPYTIHVNGKLLRMGVEIDTTLSGLDYVEYFHLAPHESVFLKTGGRKLLLLKGGIDKCNGSGCGISFYIVYDLAKHKGFLLRQFRSDFIAGADQRTGDLVFLNMDDRNNYNHLYQGFFESGKAFVFDRHNRVRPYKDRFDIQYHFKAFYGGESERLLLLGGNLPLKKQKRPQ